MNDVAFVYRVVLPPPLSSVQQMFITLMAVQHIWLQAAQLF